MPADLRPGAPERPCQPWQGRPWVCPRTRTAHPGPQHSARRRPRTRTAVAAPSVTQAGRWGAARRQAVTGSDSGPTRSLSASGPAQWPWPEVGARVSESRRSVGRPVSAGGTSRRRVAFWVRPLWARLGQPTRKTRAAARARGPARKLAGLRVPPAADAPTQPRADARTQHCGTREGTRRAREGGAALAEGAQWAPGVLVPSALAEGALAEGARGIDGLRMGGPGREGPGKGRPSRVRVAARLARWRQRSGGGRLGRRPGARVTVTPFQVAAGRGSRSPSPGDLEAGPIRVNRDPDDSDPSESQTRRPSRLLSR
jgi:hypothetical protein